MKIPRCSIVDFETAGIQPRPLYPPVPVGVAIKLPTEKKARYLAWGHPSGNNCTKKEAALAVKEAYAVGDGVVMHNDKFDLDVAEVHLGIKPPSWDRVHDTLLLAFLHDPHSTVLSLKPLAAKILNLPPDEQDAVKKWILENIPAAKKAPSTWGAYISQAPVSIVGPYACGDVLRTDQLFSVLHKKVMDANMSVAYDRERQLTPVLLQMERTGVGVNLKSLERDAVQFDKLIVETIDPWIRKRLKSPSLNVDSGAELADAIDAAGKSAGWPMTDKGSRSTSSEALEVALTDKQLLAVLQYRAPLSTSVTTFIKPWLNVARETGGIIHTSWNQVRADYHSSGAAKGARTGRLCIVAGSLIKQPGKDVPIENVKAGDLVYCFDDQLELRLRKVLWSGKTGKKKVIRIKWMGTGGHHTGMLELTPDHPVRLITGEYKPAGELKYGDRVLALHRTLGKYNRLEYLDCDGKETRECRIVYRETNDGTLSEHVHHKDHNPCNDDPTNLEGLTSSAHTSYHAKHMWKTNPPKVLRGVDHPLFKETPLYDVVWSALKRNRFMIVRTSRELLCTTDMLKRWCKELNIFDTPEMTVLARNRSGKRTSGQRPINKSDVVRARKIHKEDGPYVAMKSLGVSWYRYQALQEYFKFKPIPSKSNRSKSNHNHMIIVIEEVIGKHDVYDIEVEEHHNFIANELCIHNSSNPNFQNIIKIETLEKVEKLFQDAKIKNLVLPPPPNVRGYIVPRAKGNILNVRDYSQQELRILGHYEDDVLAQAYVKTPTLDMHDLARTLVNDLLGSNYDRKPIKNLGFGLIYGMGIGKTAIQLGVDVTQAKSVKQAYLAVFPGLKRLTDDLKWRGRLNEPIMTWGGRVYYVEPPKVIKGRTHTYEYKLLNVLIQGSAADCTKQSLINYANMTKTGKILLTVHDEIMVEVPKADRLREMKLLQEAMNSVKFDVPMLSDGAWSDTSWMNLKKMPKGE